MRRKIILRADGNAIIGHGHIYRLLALADILKDEFEIIFAISAPSEHISKVIRYYVNELIELPGRSEYKLPALKLLDEEIPFDLTGYIKANEIVVIDGYWFGTRYQNAAKIAGAKLVCIDDFASNYFYADAVINHAPGMSASQYKGEPYTKYYLGLDFALLRKDFFKPFAGNRVPDSLLISMGATDHFSITENVLEAAILSNAFKTIHLLVTSAFSAEAKDRMNNKAQASFINILTHNNLDANELVDLMDICSFALVSASTVLLECYSRGIACFVGYYTNNQANIYDGFIHENKAVGLGDLNFSNPQRDILELSKKVNKLAQVEKATVPLKSYDNLKQIFARLCR